MSGVPATAPPRKRRGRNPACQRVCARRVAASPPRRHLLGPLRRAAPRGLHAATAADLQTRRLRHAQSMVAERGLRTQAAYKGLTLQRPPVVRRHRNARVQAVPAMRSRPRAPRPLTPLRHLHHAALVHCPYLPERQRRLHTHLDACRRGLFLPRLGLGTRAAQKPLALQPPRHARFDPRRHRHELRLRRRSRSHEPRSFARRARNPDPFHQLAGMS